MNIHSLRYGSVEPRLIFESLPAITLVAGENGSGKSRLLRDLAIAALDRGRRILAISNSPYHRFNSLGPMAQVLAPRRKGASPDSVLKAAIRLAHERDEVRLRSISRVLRHCGYSPAVGVEFVSARRTKRFDPREQIDLLSARRGRPREDLESAVFRVMSLRKGETYWIDFDGTDFELSSNRDIARLLFWEEDLVELGVVAKIDIKLYSAGHSVGLRDASSGEVSLITSMAFIAANSSEIDVLLLDEPENSLHPQWQRDYLDLLQGALGYSGAMTVIATHSPVVVMGLESLSIGKQLLALSRSFTDSDDIEGDSLEAVMAKVFMLVTPRSHFLSQYLVEILDRIDEGSLSLSGARSELNDLRLTGLDEKQETALEVVEMMAQSISRRRNELP